MFIFECILFFGMVNLRIEFNSSGILFFIVVLLNLCYFFCLYLNVFCFLELLILELNSTLRDLVFHPSSIDIEFSRFFFLSLKSSR